MIDQKKEERNRSEEDRGGLERKEEYSIRYNMYNSIV
jgi:hypothetical protein